MSTKVNTSKVVLTGELEELAVTQIKAFAKDADKAKAGINSMSGHILVLAKRAEKDGGAEKRDELFKALCRHAETVYEQENSKDGEKLPIKKLLPFWPVAKSQVRAGISAGLRMADYKTVYEITQAVPKKERTPKTPTDKTGQATSEDGAVSLPKGAHGEALRAALQRFHRTIRAVVVQRPELIADSAVKIMALCDSIDEDAKLIHDADVKGRRAPSAGTANPIGMPGSQAA